MLCMCSDGMITKCVFTSRRRTLTYSRHGLIQHAVQGGGRQRELRRRSFWMHFDALGKISKLWLIRTLIWLGIMPDVLHALDQGVSTHVTANTCIDVCEQGHWGGNQQLQLKGLQRELEEWCDEHRERFRLQGELTWARLRTSNDWPKLKAKAAQVRHICRFALYLAEKYRRRCARYNDHDTRRFVVCKLLCRYYEILSEDGIRHSKANILELSHLEKFSTRTTVI